MSVVSSDKSKFPESFCFHWLVYFINDAPLFCILFCFFTVQVFSPQVWSLSFPTITAPIVLHCSPLCSPPQFPLPNPLSPPLLDASVCGQPFKGQLLSFSDPLCCHFFFVNCNLLIFLLVHNFSLVFDWYKQNYFIFWWADALISLEYIPGREIARPLHLHIIPNSFLN